MSPGDLPTIVRKIGATTYIISAEYSKIAKENAVDKMRRIILKNLKNVS